MTSLSKIITKKIDNELLKYPKDQKKNLL